MKRLWVFGIVGLILVALGLFLIFGIDTKEEIKKEPVNTNPNPAPAKPSVPSRCSLVAKNDTYEKPDFNRLKNIMSSNEIVKAVPEKGSILMSFYHFTEGCRIWDKHYVLSGGKIKDGSGQTDIQIWMHSKYVDMISESNFCDIIKEARNNGDLGQDSKLGEATLLWRYKSMIKYKDCLGISLG
jgi:hypothetical protein